MGLITITITRGLLSFRDKFRAFKSIIIININDNDNFIVSSSMESTSGYICLAIKSHSTKSILSIPYLAKKMSWTVYSSGNWRAAALYTVWSSIGLTHRIVSHQLVRNLTNTCIYWQQTRLVDHALQRSPRGSKLIGFAYHSPLKLDKSGKAQISASKPWLYNSICLPCTSKKKVKTGRKGLPDHTAPRRSLTAIFTEAAAHFCTFKARYPARTIPTPFRQSMRP